MLAHYRPLSTRILTLRPLRPPSHVPRPRPFTQNSQLLLLTTHTPRPQLPYLAQPSLRHTSLSPTSRIALRLLSTETRTYVKDQVWLAAKWSAYGWTFLILSGISWFAFQIIVEEKKNPTPEEWTFITGHSLRAARSLTSPEVVDELGYVDWARVGTFYRRVVVRLERKDVDGKDVDIGGAGDIYIPDIGYAGNDISAKSWPWRAGYFEALMGSAKAAEHMESMVLDTTRSMVFPKEVMIGPSNPDPRPTPPYMHSAPLEENCAPAFEAPEIYYMRILTGRGFTTGQKLEAASAYANCLGYRGLNESAEEMYKWAVDIAKGALPEGTDPEKILDSKTAILKTGDGSADITPNLLRTTTDLAIHYARIGNVAAALPILLSILRARRSASISPFPIPESSNSSTDSSFWLTFFTLPTFPPPPPSGDLPYIRASEKPTCEESELMLYIGEILFATSPDPNEGLAWTQQAVTIADANVTSQGSSSASVDGNKRRCKECLFTGVSNWDAMLKRVAEKQLDGSASVLQKGWFGWGSAKAAEDQRSQIEEQQRHVDALRDRIVREKIQEEVAKGRNTNPSGVWLG